jgi:hypothetical protein
MAVPRHGSEAAVAVAPLLCRQSRGTPSAFRSRKAVVAFQHDDRPGASPARLTSTSVPAALRPRRPTRSVLRARTTRAERPQPAMPHHDCLGTGNALQHTSAPAPTTDQRHSVGGGRNRLRPLLVRRWPGPRIARDALYWRVARRASSDGGMPAFVSARYSAPSARNPGCSLGGRRTMPGAPAVASS